MSVSYRSRSSVLMRLRPPPLRRPYGAPSSPGLRSAPGCSSGFDLRPSGARTARPRVRGSGLRLAAHAASIGADGVVMRGPVYAPVPPIRSCPEGQEMGRLQPLFLDLGGLADAIAQVVQLRP